LQIDILTDPKDWLTERLGEVVLLAPEDDEAEGTGAGQPAAPASRCVFESRIQDGSGRSHEPVYTDSIRYDVGVPASAEVSQFIPLRLRSLHIESAPEFMVALPSGRPRWFVSIDHSNVVLPIEVDEVTTWERIQPGTAHVMRAAGAVPLSYTDMATAYPELFPSRQAARKTIKREAENRGQTPIEDGQDGRNWGQTPVSISL
jgi:hypothetical protein